MPPMNIDEIQVSSNHHFNPTTNFNPAICRSERLYKHLKARNDGVPIPTETPEEKEMLDAVRKIETAVVNNDVGAHYRYQYNGINLDPYRIIKVYGITEPAAQHALKKILCAGKRGHNTVIQDIDDVINAMNRWKEMILEDNKSA